MLGASILQIFFPSYMGSHSGYGSLLVGNEKLEYGLAVLILILGVNIKYDWFYLRIVLLTLIFGGIGIGTNHLVNFMEYHSPVNAIGAFENYLLATGWIVGWLIEHHSHKEDNC